MDYLGIFHTFLGTIQEEPCPSMLMVATMGHSFHQQMSLITTPYLVAGATLAKRNTFSPKLLSEEVPNV